MNSSQFMDKQIMGLSGSQSSDILDLLNSQEEQNGAGKKEEILPSYDFQPMRPASASHLEGDRIVGARGWNSADSKANTSGLSNYGSQFLLDSHKVTPEKERGFYDTNMVSEFDGIVQKYTDTLLHALDSLSARVSQIETRIHHFESSIDDLKISIGNHHGSTDGRLRQMENVLREVQASVQVVRDKQEMAEAQVQLAKLQVSKPVETSNTMQTEGLQQSPQSVQQPPLPPLPVHQPPSLPPPTVPLPPPSQQSSISPPVSLPNQLTQSHMPPPPSLPREPYHQQVGQPLDNTQTQLQMPSQQQQPVLPQSYQQIPYLQPSQLPPQQPPTGSVKLQFQPQLSHLPDEHAYMATPPPSYPPNMRPSVLASQPPSGSPPSQQFYGPNSPIYESSGNRSAAAQAPFPAGYGPPPPPPGSNFSDSYPYSGSPYGGSLKHQGHSLPSAPSGGSGYSRLPTAQLLPQSIPTASTVGGGSPSSGSGSRVPIDDVVDKVTTMGFPREVVRATVRKLTENGQSVDLNVVLDKLMNDGEIQPQKGWFGR